jgi:hypothetical protein
LKISTSKLVDVFDESDEQVGCYTVVLPGHVRDSIYELHAINIAIEQGDASETDRPNTSARVRTPKPVRRPLSRAVV